MFQTKIKIIILSLLSTLIASTAAYAQSSYNLGNLDIQLSNGHEQIFINTLPGQQFSEEIRLSNFSNENLKLSIYVIDADWQNNNFIPAPDNSQILDSAKWIKLPTSTIELSPQETKLISTKIIVPENSGIGKHYAAIMFKYQHLDSNNNVINLEKGLRVTTNVVGKAESKYQLINPQLSQTDRFSTYSATLLNSGNTNLKGAINLTNQNADTANTKQSETIFLTPGSSQKINLAVEKPYFGPDTVSAKINLANTTKTFVLNENFYLPTEILIFLSIATIGIVAFNLRNSVESKKLFAFIILGIFTVIITFNLSNISKTLFTDVLGTNPETGYLTTIKWGHFSEENRDRSTALWNGSLKLSSGKMLILEKLHNESKDRLYLNSLGNSLNFSNVTGADNDGIILFIKPDSTDSAPSLLYKNNLSNEEVLIDLKSSTETANYIDFKDSQIEIASEIAGNTVTIKRPDEDTTIDTITFGEVTTPIIEVESTLDSTEIINEGESTEDISTVPSSEIEPDNSAQLQEEIALLREIIQDIPASADVLSEYILNSNYVQEVISENNSTRVSADPLLIEKLKETPITIQEITATPDLNFIFVPSDSIELVPQQFSFDQARTTSQELGEIVFVQNKLSSWNTYFTISDFVSVSGRGSIPATNVSLNPGSIKVINQTGEEAILEPGAGRRMFSTGDQATLVSVTPQGEGETIFSMKPQISLEIPANTPPGLYRAEISIKVI